MWMCWLPRLAAVLLGRDVTNRLGEFPPVAGQVFDRALPLAILALDGRLQHLCPMRKGLFVPSINVVDAYLEEVGDRT